MLAVWAKILKRVPNSVLWLYKHPTMAVLRLLQQVLGLADMLLEQSWSSLT